jgi:hypothetical protein
VKEEEKVTRTCYNETPTCFATSFQLDSTLAEGNNGQLGEAQDYKKSYYS